MNPSYVFDAHKLRQSAALLRSAWAQSNYWERKGRDLAVCIMGSIAKVADPSLNATSPMHKWEDTSNAVLEANPTLALALAAVCEPRLAGLTDPRWVRLRDMEHPGYNHVGLRVCLTNIATVKDGEDAAALVEQAARLLDPVENESTSPSGGPFDRRLSRL